MVGQKTGGRKRGTPNKETVARRRKAEEDRAQAFVGLSEEQIQELEPKDVLRLVTLHYIRVGDPKEARDSAAKWAPYVHPAKSALNVGLTLDDIRRIANAARAEAARRGLIGEVAEGNLVNET